MDDLVRWLGEQFAGVLLLIVGAALMIAEVWVTTFDPVTGVACLALTGLTEAVIASELWQEWRP